MKNVLFSAFLLYSVLQVLGKCPDDCKHRNFLYESFQCTPNCIGTDDCPTSYDCTSIYQHNDMCFYNGKYYKNDETIQDDTTWENCMGCSCTKDENNKTTFICYYADCAAPFPIDESCVYKYKLGQCCFAGVICPPFTKCLLEGEVFYEENGKFLHPKDNCTKCVCERNGCANGVIQCQKQYCRDLLFYQQDIKKMCAPFYNNVLYDCCPSQWICPNNTVVDVHTHRHNDSLCLFGDKFLKKKEKIYIDHEIGNIVCECKLPPYATCSLLVN
ncbi:hypothetical protein RN001_013726 [Aquatica leii]|uniref:VWFC domain-containing protein n=1 Tax=Aquatica leii TaxID=1421715 RepID=A0AAN7S767_9COLE|nr:hypothetical protein RN001_013726 [Aquatica leii]